MLAIFLIILLLIALGSGFLFSKLLWIIAFLLLVAVALNVSSTRRY